MRVVAGIDAGSRAIKIVLLDPESLRVAAGGVVDQGIDQGERIAHLMVDLRGQAGADGEPVNIVATGYGRNRVAGASRTVTEITCHAVGVRRELSQARMIVDIGGQDSKLIRLEDTGTVCDFVMNDRCAAGTGRFLEIVASRLESQPLKLGELDAAAREPAMISSMCAVFAETEVIGLLASGARPEDIAAGVQVSLARRVAGMAGGRIASPVVFTGGVAMIAGMVRALEAALGCSVLVPASPQMTGALGAALLAVRGSING